MLVTLSGITISESFSQELNADEPILVRPSGKITLVSFCESEKAEPDMVVVPERTSYSPLLPAGYFKRVVLS